MQILPYNRTVKDLAGRRRRSFSPRCVAPFSVSDGAGDAAAQREVSMYLGGRWYTIDLSAARRGRFTRERLDVALLQRQVLEPLLGIGDIRTDKRIDFVGGARGPGARSRRSTRARPRSRSRCSR